jgi:hypothetical protein
LGEVIIEIDSATQHEDLVHMARELMPVLESAASDLTHAAGLGLTRIVVRITDRLAEEVQGERSEGLPEYSTERVGGEVAGISLRRRDADEGRRVLINAAALAADVQGFGKTFLPATIAHEVAHCLLDESRRVHGNPEGFIPSAPDLIATIGALAVNACDEYLADEIAKALLPPIVMNVIQPDGEVVVVEDRLINACGWVARTCDDLDQEMYPALLGRVQLYRETDGDLEGMSRQVLRGVDACLIASAHFRSSTQPFDIEGMGQVAAHPATLLYLGPFWATVGPLLDARVTRGSLQEFIDADQSAFDVASQAVRRLLATLGLAMERTPDDRVFVHVDEPQDLS